MIECHETKSKIIATLNHSKENVTTNVNLKLTETRKLLEARENASDHFEIGCSFESDWLKERREFCGPISERRKAMTMHSRRTFDIQYQIDPLTLDGRMAL